MDLTVFKTETCLAKQRKLFKECFPETIGTSVEKDSHYQWKFHSYPATPCSYEYAAFEKDDLIGYYAAIPYEYCYKSEVCKVAMVCDVMTGMKARGKGVFTKMGVYSTQRLKDEGLAFSIGYPIRPEVIPGHIKAGWEKMFPLPLYIKFLSTTSLLKQKKLGFLAPFLNLVLYVYNGVFSLLFNSKKYDLSSFLNEQVEEIEGLEEFLSEWIKEQSIALNKTLQFLKWRLGAPGKKYHIIVARKNKRIVGYAVISFVTKENIPSVAILDISCLKAHKGVSSAIFSKIDILAKYNKAEAIMIMTSKYVCGTYSLFRNGFFKSPYKFWLIIKNFNRGFSSSVLKDEKNWHLTWIDSDDL